MTPPPRSATAPLLLLAGAAVLLLVLPQYSTAAYLRPVVSIGPACAAACADISTMFAYACGQCMLATGWFVSWSNTSQPALSFKRLPLYESGYQYMPGFPLLNVDPSMYPEFAGIAFLRRSPFPDYPKNVTICYNDTATGARQCTTRNMGAPIIIPNASSPTGFCYGGEGWVKLDPACDGHVDPLENVSFNTPDQLGLVYATGRNQSIFVDSARQYAEQLFTNVTAAADSIWNFQFTWSETTYYIQLKASDLPQMQRTFGSDWTSDLTDKLNQGVLLLMDLGTWFQDIKVDFGDTMQPGANMVFERVYLNSTYLVHRVVLLRLNDPGNRSAPQVYSVAKSPTGFLIGMVYARTTMAFMTTWLSHNYHYHITSMAVAYSMFNTIDPGVPALQSKHPLRLLLDTYLEPQVTVNIHLGVYLGTATPPYTVIGPPYFFQMFNLYVQNGPLGNDNTYWNIHPERMAVRGGLNVADYTSPGGKPWDLYERMMMSLDAYGIVRKFTNTVIRSYYKSNADVRKDKDLQDFVTHLKDPLGGNLIRINEDNKVTTVEELVNLTAQMMYHVMMHSTLHTAEYITNGNNVATGTSRIATTVLPDPSGTYTVDQMMALMPNMLALGKQLPVYNLIEQGDPVGGSWIPTVPGTTNTPDWEGNLPFPANDKKGKKANAATVDFRKEFTTYFRDFKNGILKEQTINYDWPFQFTTKIDY